MRKLVYSVKGFVQRDIFRYVVSQSVIAEQKLLGFGFAVAAVKNKAFAVKQSAALKAEHLIAGFTVVGKAGDNVLVEHLVCNDLLLVAHFFYCGDFVADPRRAFKFKILGGFLHLLGKVADRGSRAALQKLQGLSNAFLIIL